jgi:hypothetical protein
MIVFGLSAENGRWSELHKKKKQDRHEHEERNQLSSFDIFSIVAVGHKLGSDIPAADDFIHAPA